jgi:ribonuclease R
MNESLQDRVLALLRRPNYVPAKPKALARRLGISAGDYAAFRAVIKELVRRNRVEIAKGHTLRLATRHDQAVGVFRSIRGGGGFVRPKPGQGQDVGEIYVKPARARDAASGDVVLVSIYKFPKVAGRVPEGEIREVIERASDRFVGTYHEHMGEGLVHVDGRVFHEDIYVGDAGAKGARPGDKVVVEMLRFPSAEMTGEGVIAEVLGPRSKPGVDLLSVIRQFHLPDAFPAEVLAEARQAARLFEDQAIGPDRRDLTSLTTVTVDPSDAKDFDDAISLERDDDGYWHLGVHIADVSWFVPPGSALDHEARKRGNSVYLPGAVLPMLPELISNGLASLQEGKIRYTKSALIELDPEGRVTDFEFANSAIRVSKRLNYAQVMDLFLHPDKPHGRLGAKMRALLDRMRRLAAILRQRRRGRGFMELSMKECELEYDADGKVTAAHYTVDDESHQMIEEFMLTANEAVARKLKEERVAFLRRVHEAPDPLKLKSFSEFAASMGIRIEDYRSRFELQRILREVVGKPPQHAVHFALLRSLKIASYGPQDEGHWALASDCYCHFTSPIRRYPDLTVHRLLDKLLRTGKAGADEAEWVALGEHCSFTERRADLAERELMKIKLLDYLSRRIGMQLDTIITGVEEFGFFAQGVDFPAEGLVHVRTLVDDFYKYDAATHSLVGRRKGRRYRLGDRVSCVIWKVDQEQRELDLRLFEPPHRVKLAERGKKFKSGR